MTKRVAFLFPGQGAQEVGMGRDLFGRDDFADTLADAASQASGADIVKLCTRGPVRALADTKVLQPALTTICLSLWNKLIEGGLTPSVTAGHSIGELPALVAAGMADPVEIVKVAALRGSLMGDAASVSPGGMLAVTGTTLDLVEEKISHLKERGTLAVAAVNAPNQVTLSGDPNLLEEAEIELRKIPDTKLTHLRVSGAWHSEHMQPAVFPLQSAMLKLNPTPGSIPMVFNRTGLESNANSNIPILISHQLINPVRWDLVMKKLIELDIKDFIEIGPGRVLRGLVRLNTTDPNITVHNVTDVRSAKRVLAQLV